MEEVIPFALVGSSSSVLATTEEDFLGFDPPLGVEHAFGILEELLVGPLKLNGSLQPIKDDSQD
ncbi:hypothetical protein Tco_0518575, partial [Tanacetum coccineum]